MWFFKVYLGIVWHFFMLLIPLWNYTIIYMNNYSQMDIQRSFFSGIPPLTDFLSFSKTYIAIWFDQIYQNTSVYILKKKMPCTYLFTFKLVKDYQVILTNLSVSILSMGGGTLGIACWLMVRYPAVVGWLARARVGLSSMNRSCFCASYWDQTLEVFKSLDTWLPDLIYD